MTKVMEHAEIWKNLLLENMEGEVWKDIHGYEGHYQISNMGRIKSLGRFILEQTKPRTEKEKILKIRKLKLGYIRGYLSKNGRLNGFTVHRLVATAFIPNPENKRTVNHKNGVKSDNRIENLEWATHKENTRHAYDTNLCNPRVGQNVIGAKLRDKDVIKIRELLQAGCLLHKEIAAMFGVKRQCVGKIKNNLRWKHI